MTFGLFDPLFGYSDSFIVLTGVLLFGGGLGNWLKDRFTTLNTLADSFERKCLEPVGLAWKQGGNPISWIHHALWTAAVSLLGVGIAQATDTSIVLGAFAWACGFVLFYVIRETYSAIGSYEKGILFNRPHFKLKHPFTSRAVDGVMDVVLPASYALWLWSLI